MSEESPVTNNEPPHLDKILRGWAEMMQRGSVDLDDLPYIVPKLFEAADALAAREPDAIRNALSGDWGAFWISPDQSLRELIESLREGVRGLVRQLAAREEAKAVSKPPLVRYPPMPVIEACNAMPEPTEEVLAHATYILSEWLNDRAPIGEQRYREPARALLKFASLYHTPERADG